MIKPNSQEARRKWIPEDLNRHDPSGFEAGVIEWPIRPHGNPGIAG